MAAKTKLYTLTKPVPATYLDIAEPKAYVVDGKEKGAAKYQATFVFAPDHPDFVAIQKLVVEIAKEAFGAGVDLKALSKPWKKGETIIDGRKKKAEGAQKSYDGSADWMAGKVCLKAASQYAPSISGLDKGLVVEYKLPDDKDAVKSKFFSGVEVLAQVNFKTWEKTSTVRGEQVTEQGVTAYLQMVLSTGKGERRGGQSRSAADVFRGYAGTITAEDPTGGADELADLLS